VNANRVVTSGLFEPIKEANIVAAVTSKVSSIVVYVDEFNLMLFFNPLGSKYPISFVKPLNIFNLSLCFANALAPNISLRCRSYVIYP
jgi:hypothetical protein